MDVCDGSVTTVCEWAKVNRAPWLASRSRFGVCAGPPYADSASARSVSIVTSRTFWSADGSRTKPPARDRQTYIAAIGTSNKAVTASQRAVDRRRGLWALEARKSLSLACQGRAGGGSKAARTVNR